MAKKLVVVVSDEHSPPDFMERAGRFAEVVVASNSDRALQELRNAEGLFLWDMESTVASNSSLAPKLEWIHVPGIGVNTVISQEVLSSAVVVTNTRGVFEHPIAEYVLGMMLLVAKDFRKTYDFQRTKAWHCRPTSSLRDQVAVLIGPGAIGREIFKILTAVGVKVFPVGRRAVAGDPVFGHLNSSDELINLLPKADTVILSMPLTGETAGFMNEKRFAQMKPGSCLINIGRGGLVDESALITALQAGQVGTAALDVFADEPLREDHPFWTMDQVFVSPHMSGEVYGWEERAIEQFLENLERWAKGQPLKNVVDKAARAV
ncbi:2-hydroxyacid dehydrogenase [Mesorhizobium amorphae]|uniref:D-2-hydroxyacid dehydrogenase n=1 Tax=Mesorhizobium amorphae TaxID=71433 RepID=UPI00235DA246|nr:D-2-hydroxyacid dehydrogenase [Mesorhizobium amorphae]GLR45278.1 2-hydroxyacid dehydrogenase [Mesorhizobium amorphae]